MAIEHRNIPDSERHEPKGASTAPSGSVWVANGLGSGNFLPIGSVVPPPVTYPAGNVTIVDSGGLVASGNVEGAIQEIATKTNGLVPAGPFDNDASALAGGVARGSLYFDNSGIIHINRSL